MLEWTNGALLSEGLISAADLQLVSVTDDPEVAVETLIACYERRCFHDITDGEVPGE